MSAREPKPAEPRKNTKLIVVILFIVIAVLIETGLVISAVVSPTASRAMTTKLEEMKAAWSGQSGSPGIPARISESVNGVYQRDVVPLWKEPAAPTAASTFTKCGSCHPDFEQQVRFTHVYIDHSVHAQIGMQCAECHVSNEHPGPDRPTEAVCEECHDEVRQKGGCDFCHPAGSLPHFYLMGAPREGFIDCATCHPKETIPHFGKRLVHVGTFNGSPDTKCLQCHTKTKSWGTTTETGNPPGCKTCHQDPGHPSDWIKIHPEAALTGTQCASCHQLTWCAMRCHAVTDLTGPQYLPLPSPPEVIVP